MSEADFQRAVLDLCAHLRLLTFHSGDSRRDSSAGFPDLVIVGRSVLYRELKTATGRVRPEQVTWLTRLSLAGANAAVWRPADLHPAGGRIRSELGAIR